MKKNQAAVKLTELKKGSNGIIKDIGTDWEKSRKLLTLGILPGEEFTLLQKYPVILLKLGYSFVAVDESLGEKIQVIIQNEG
ncbi:FeoA family protein [Candidatus Contubernalis alkaliaceticus]|uniref:FeoA family protein n=1 Tax=Candidatus Contubernalis alkaliaceticus TaxID=338645 RepID=UPI001F4BF345|nr:FeoA family protein [Candidatus Contubernalis alkalaceticus]UNC90716.1 ferrous iron transport protein A [Candidatus Contubernalis alkalaceticus]